MGNFYYTYNESGRVCAIKDFDGTGITIDYNNMNKPERLVDKEGRETRREYNKMGNLCQEVSPTGAVTRYHYDRNNRLKCLEILAEEGAEAGTVLTFTHDPVGNLLHTTGGGKDGVLQETSYEYDALNRCIAVIDGAGGKTSYCYDNQGNMVYLTDPAGNSHTFSYNDAKELIEEKDALGNSTQELCKNNMQLYCRGNCVIPFPTNLLLYDIYFR